MMKSLGVSRTFFSQWSGPVLQQLGIFDFVTTDHCENLVQKWANSGNIATSLTIVKKRGYVANFFHSGPCACHNSVEFRALWRRTTVKNAFAVFHSGPVSFTMPWHVLT